MGNIRGVAVGGIVRATVSVTATSDVDHATSVNTLKAGVQYVIPATQLSYVFIVLDVAVDSIGYNKFLHDLTVMGDVAVLGVNKSFTESQAVADETTYLLFKKGNLEELHTAETHSFSIQKALNDVVAITDDFFGLANADDDQTMVFSKTLPVDYQVVLDNVDVAAGKCFTDAVHNTDSQALEVDKGLTENLGTTEIPPTFDIAKQLDDVVDAGDEFNAVASTDDGEVMVFGKTLADEWTYSDEVSVQPEKVFEDTVEHPTDQIDTIEVGKGIEDVPVTSEDMLFDTSKALEDLPVTSEQVTFGIGYTIQDWANQGEGPNQYDTYAIGYFLESYALEGFPMLDIVKGLSDTVHATDDFFGVANTDDDEVMQFGKTLGEVFHYGDETNLGYTKPLVDLVSHADTQIFFVGKLLTDQVNKSDLVIKDSGKALIDVFSSSDIVVRNTGKGISDSANTAEYNSFVLQKTLSDAVQTTDDFLGNANADDDETMLFGKTIGDSFTKSDSTVITAGKGLADAASTSESGSIVWTDYWPIDYTDTTSGVFVGNSRTF